MRISLCVICGNEAGIIERFLDSFSGAFDELSLVRAIGTTEPDATVELADAWCVRNGKDFVFAEYKNEHDGLPHVDNFGAARNLAFSGGTGDWLFWADCDDMLDDAAKLRAVLGDAKSDLLRFPYDVVGTNKRPMRERAIRRDLFTSGRGRWQFAVHENLRVAVGVTIGDASEPVWIHQPKIVAQTNRARNKAILSRTLAHTSANYFYVHQEWFCEGNKRNAERFGRLALEFPDLEPSFRYETNLNLCRLASDPDDALRHGLAAHGVFPWCREALAMIALTFIDRNDAERALFYARRLDATPIPAPEMRPWTHEPKWYGWAGNDLLARCLRIAGKHDEAVSVQRRGGKPVISLLHATRGRPAQAAHTRNQWLNLASEPEKIHHIMAVDADDAPSLRLAKQFEHVVCAGTQSCVAAWNMAADHAIGDLFVQLSDDWIPVPGWDAKLLAELGGDTSQEAVVAISDGHRTDDLLCMAICTRARWEKQGRELFSPEYESVFSDNEFSHRAWRDGVVIDARKRIEFVHLHPAFNSAPNDPTYVHTNSSARYRNGKATFLRRNPDANKSWST